MNTIFFVCVFLHILFGQLNSFNIDTLEARASLHLYKLNYDKAEEYYDWLIDGLDEKRFLIQKGRLYLRTQKLTKLSNTYKHIPEQIKSRYLYDITLFCIALKKYKQALKYASLGVQNGYEARYVYIFLSLSEKQKTYNKLLYQEIAKRFPSNSTVHYYLAKYHLYFNRFDTARTYATEINRNLKEVRFQSLIYQRKINSAKKYLADVTDKSLHNLYQRLSNKRLELHFKTNQSKEPFYHSEAQISSITYGSIYLFDLEIVSEIERSLYFFPSKHIYKQLSGHIQFGYQSYGYKFSGRLKTINEYNFTIKKEIFPNFYIQLGKTRTNITSSLKALENELYVDRYTLSLGYLAKKLNIHTHYSNLHFSDHAHQRQFTAEIGTEVNLYGIHLYPIGTYRFSHFYKTSGKPPSYWQGKYVNLIQFGSEYRYKSDGFHFVIKTNLQAFAYLGTKWRTGSGVTVKLEQHFKPFILNIGWKDESISAWENTSIFLNIRF